jgi:hypothetical protein
MREARLIISPLVLAALSKLDAWFSEFDSKLKRKLPVEFDVAYFCSGLEMLLLLDHHQLSARVVSFLYNYAHIFAGDNRIVVICDFLLNKFFYKLFLNWDDVVRNYFQQFIIFKVCFYSCHPRCHKIVTRPNLSI